MAVTITIARRALQIAVAVFALVPILAGGAGILFGKDFLGTNNADISFDSHFRYLSAILFTIGIVFLSYIPKIERVTREVRVLTFLIFIGGLVRLGAAIFTGWPATPMILAIVMELAVTPALCIWQAWVAKKYQAF